MNAKEIKKVLIDKELSITELARKIKISRAYLSYVIHGHHKGERIWPQIAEILDIEFKKAA